LSHTTLNTLARADKITTFDLAMDIKAEVGETAGKIWHLLEREGPQTLAQAKKKLNLTGDLLDFAVGWLAREEKVDIVRDKKGIRVRLK
jgi:hypothetical protein